MRSRLPRLLAGLRDKLPKHLEIEDFRVRSIPTLVAVFAIGPAQPPASTYLYGRAIRYSKALELEVLHERDRSRSQQ